MPEFRIIPLGVGDAFAARHYTTCLALGAGDAWILVDCPHPVRKMLREGSHAAGEPFDLDRVSAVALTHLHGDHCSGLEIYGFYSYYVLGRRAHVLAHPDVSAKLWSGVLTGGMSEARETPGAVVVPRRFDEFFDLTDLSLTDAVSFGPFSIECRMTRHPVPTTAFKITACGRVLGLSSDTAYDPALIDWFAAADLIVHEVTTYPSSDVHTPYLHLAALPAEIRSKMRLNHYSDDFDLTASAIEPLREGRFYEV